jgi:hypothetical protein
LQHAKTQSIGAALLALNIAVWLLGSVLRIAIRLFQLVLLIIIADIELHQWLQRRRAPKALNGEIFCHVELVGQCHDKRSHARP